MISIIQHTIKTITPVALSLECFHSTFFNHIIIQESCELIIPIICTPMMPGVYEEVIGSNIICFILNGKRDDLKGR
jgi:hypothetical protein